ncbi:DUF1769-domain-containing protein, partial [Plenodomus tracheiphilus IPT5]
IDPTARDKYLLQVNSPQPISIDSTLLTAWLHVRILDYHGLPPSSPPTSSYFQHASHTSDRYSISYSFIPKRDISGSQLIMGFDYSHSIKHQLPPGTKTALKIATSWLDPGLYADPYAEEPYLYGPALSSWFAFSIGELTSCEDACTQLSRLQQESKNIITEGATSSSASKLRTNIPSSYKKRRKHFLSPSALSSFTFEKDRMYHADFFNPHLDFANFALRLPGFSVGVARYVDEKTHHLRYVLREKEGDVGVCVIFSLLFGRELEETKRRGVGSGTGVDEIGEEGVTRVSEDGQADNADEVEENSEKYNEQRDAVPESRAEDLETTVVEQKEQEGIGGIISTATAAASTLATSIYGVYAALGFATASESSSDTEDDDTRQHSTISAHAQIDDMDDATVEKYLQARQSNL